MKTRKAIALIELIFAIVVIAITLLSVPNLISQTTKASNQAITQEAISNAGAYSSVIMSSFWDEACVDPIRGNPVLVVDKNTSGLTEKEVNSTLPVGGGALPTPPTNIAVGLGLRPGSPQSSFRRFVPDIAGNRYTATPPTNLGLEPTDLEPNDVDDFNNKESNLTLETQTSAKSGDYKDITIKIKTEVAYIDDTPNPSFDNVVISYNNPFNNELNISTNIKKITLTLTSDNDKNKKVVLKSFSCNIGSGKLKDRVFP